ncbi:hypothetical protein F2P81_008280 [Scophthalmus maximus]|uniref:Uncharacterized protein n=1 Tax=Scophthalmus maximus TaxID=52904 RepID=A0A6A4T4J3_SCOMX|nr:hypothetical protein F2P81_008280 [Scophthalmus maximus]
MQGSGDCREQEGQQLHMTQQTCSAHRSLAGLSPAKGQIQTCQRSLCTQSKEANRDDSGTGYKTTADTLHIQHFSFHEMQTAVEQRRPIVVIVSKQKGSVAGREGIPIHSRFCLQIGSICSH